MGPKRRTHNSIRVIHTQSQQRLNMLRCAVVLYLCFERVKAETYRARCSTLLQLLVMQERERDTQNTRASSVRLPPSAVRCLCFSTLVLVDTLTQTRALTANQAKSQCGVGYAAKLTVRFCPKVECNSSKKRKNKRQRFPFLWTVRTRKHVITCRCFEKQTSRSGEACRYQARFFNIL